MSSVIQNFFNPIFFLQITPKFLNSLFFFKFHKFLIFFTNSFFFNFVNQKLTFQILLLSNMFFYFSVQDVFIKKFVKIKPNTDKFLRSVQYHNIKNIYTFLNSRSVTKTYNNNVFFFFNLYFISSKFLSYKSKSTKYEVFFFSLLFWNLNIWNSIPTLFFFFKNRILIPNIYFLNYFFNSIFANVYNS